MIALIQSLDTSVLHTLADIRTPAMTLFFIGVSELGRAVVIYGLAACIALVYALRTRFVPILGLFLATASTGIAVLLVKGSVARVRPELAFAAYREVWWSFPSAHAAMSLAFYGLLAYLLWRSRASAGVKCVALVCVAILVLGIGFSRLYLGVHYMSDVIGGYMLGSACLALAIWAMRRLQS